MAICALSATLVGGLPFLSGESLDDRLGTASSGHAGSAPTRIVADEFDIALDPSIAPVDREAIIAETRGAGFRVLGDGEVLRGRVLAEGIFMPPGARVGYTRGTQIVSSGPYDLFLGTFVPVLDDDDDAIEPDDDEWPMAEQAAADDTLPGDHMSPWPAQVCGGLPSPNRGRRGSDVPTLELICGQDAEIADAAVFTEALAGDAPDAAHGESVGGLGGHSAYAIGGDGGRGSTISIFVGGKLTIDGTMTNAIGGTGGLALAIGQDGSGCAAAGCGGDAFAVGGKGGTAGSIYISTNQLRWTNPKIVLRPGGVGGEAIAWGGAGGNCPTCEHGGRGGWATAHGGRGGDGPYLTIEVSTRMVPSAARLKQAITVEAAARGGPAEAAGGRGGNAGPCPCNLAGAFGGAVGRGWARGGRGADGLRFDQARTLVGYLGEETITELAAGNGGRGGHAYVTFGAGGVGSSIESCECHLPGGRQGGRGGTGGHGFAIGGRGGDVHGNLSLGFRPTSGRGGDATSHCNVSGAGGDGNSCHGPDGPCQAGPGGEPGLRGFIVRMGGFAGKVHGGGTRGSRGTPAPDATEECDLGAPGNSGQNNCGQTPPDPCGDPASGPCDTTHGAPGCIDPECCQVVCAADPFCCAVAWDGLCVAAAQEMCELGGASCIGDLNGDGVVDTADLMILLSQWGPCPGCSGDLNGDGVVDVQDQMILMDMFGPCP